jgi:hypothetical protein
MRDSTATPHLVLCPHRRRFTCATTIRTYDYWLGGEDNYAADRADADAALKAWPDLPFGAGEPGVPRRPGIPQRPDERLPWLAPKPKGWHIAPILVARCSMYALTADPLTPRK